MKLAEALLERKSLLEKVNTLRARLEENVLVQEGDQPAERPAALLAELEEAIRRLEELIQKINAANNAARIEDGLSISEAIVRRDMLKLLRQTLEHIAESASLRQHRYGRMEVKFVATISTADLRRQVDELARDWRTLDASIQAANWTNELAL